MGYKPGPDPNRNLVLGGKPAGLRTIIERRFGKNAEDAFEYLASVLSGQAETTQEKVLADGRIVEYRVRPTIDEKAKAAELIIAYAHGRPTQNAVIRATTDANGLPDTELQEQVRAILERQQKLALTTQASAEVTDAEFTER